MRFNLHIIFDEDGEPVSFLKELKGVLYSLTEKTFDTLVGMPECRKVEVHTLEMEVKR